MGTPHRCGPLTTASILPSSISLSRSRSSKPQSWLRERSPARALSSLVGTSQAKNPGAISRSRKIAIYLTLGAFTTA